MDNHQQPQSPQTFSRIHRPWLSAAIPSPAPSFESVSHDDDRQQFSDADSQTSESTTSSATSQPSHSPQLPPMAGSASADTSTSCASHQLLDADQLSNVARINERLFANLGYYPHQPLPALPLHHYPMPAAYATSTAATASPPATAAAATDPMAATAVALGYTAASDYLSQIELAYQRVLAEEAAAKQQLGARKQRPKKHKCPHCAVSFSNNGQLQGHIRSHTGERPFRCEAADCGKAFTRNEELTRHRRIHTGVRPYACGTCSKSFGRRDHLKKHMRTHMPAYHQQQQQHQQMQLQQHQLLQAEAAWMMYPYLYNC